AQTSQLYSRFFSKKSERGLREAFETLQWLITALVLALFFRAAIMEAYRIPTGSMATTLKGSHFRLYCHNCGFDFERGFDPADYEYPADSLPPDGKAIPYDCQCPNCGYKFKYEQPIWVSAGDRILVLKCQYQFVEPKRWDVIVFKEPAEPTSNVIKRLVALPGETVEIVDGDIYINGKIARKPDSLQQRLWVPVYNNDYQPVKIDNESSRARLWDFPWQYNLSKWNVDGASFKLICDSDAMCELTYDDSQRNGLKASYAYNGSVFRDDGPYCGDLKIDYCLQGRGDVSAGIELTENGQTWRGWTANGMMYIGGAANGRIEMLVEKSFTGAWENGVLISFAKVDRRLIFQCDEDSISYDLGDEPNSLGEMIIDDAPVVKILAAGEVRISHLAIFRDIYYTCEHFAGESEKARAATGNSFKLEADEYFVLGDNSPNSYDGRWWTRPGIGNNGKTYRPGIVPRDYLLGRAVYVYWPNGFRPFEKFRTAMIPNFGQMRFIYGGSDSKN
ncbi:MAG: signal peptidase I, partial [Phycisphaerae bacterium]